MADCGPILPFIQSGWIGVEIGVSYGDSALALFQHGVKFLYLIDPWADYPDYLEEVRGEGWETIYRAAMDKLSPYASKHAHLRLTSAEAAQYIPGNLDFVWVDGNHRYEFVKSDLELYWPKIKSGGILCGHDYTDNEDTCQVKRAVGEFANNNGLPVEFRLPCWVIRK